MPRHAHAGHRRRDTTPPGNRRPPRPVRPPPAPAHPLPADLRELVVDRPAAGMRLRDFLAQRLGISGNRAKAMLDARVVFVNGRRIWMAGHALTGGDKVRIPLAAMAPPADPARTAAADQAPPPVPAAIHVLFADPDYLVVAKPAGLSSNGPDSLEARLRVQRAEPELRAAHRLDRDTSGCLLVARSPAAFDAAVEAFRAHDVAKDYDAIVMGRPQPPQRRIDTPLDGLTATTRFRTRRATSGAAHLAVQTLTGRTHQVRRHLADIGHPVLGDRQYGPQSGLAPPYMQVPRQMLHATRLQMPHPRTGQPLAVQAPLPADFLACLKAFGLA